MTCGHCLLSLGAGDVGQEPERSRLSPLPNLTRVCVTFEKVWVSVPPPRALREEGRSLVPFPASWFPRCITPCIIGNFHLKIFLSNV